MSRKIKLFDFAASKAKLNLSARVQALSWGKYGTELLFGISGNYPEMGDDSNTSKAEDAFWSSATGLYVVNFGNKKISKISIPGLDGRTEQFLSYAALGNDIFVIEADNSPTRVIDLSAATVTSISKTNQISVNFNGDYTSLQTTQIGADMSLVYGKMLEPAITTFATGKWAESQWPIISPSGNKIAYTYSPIANNDSIWIYDTANKTKSQIIEARYNDSNSTAALRWIDDNNLIFYATGRLGKNYYVYNLADKSITLINK